MGRMVGVSARGADLWIVQVGGGCDRLAQKTSASVPGEGRAGARAVLVDCAGSCRRTIQYKLPPGLAAPVMAGCALVNRALTTGGIGERR